MEHRAYEVDATALALRLPFRCLCWLQIAVSLQNICMLHFSAGMCGLALFFASCSPPEGRGHSLYYGNNVRKKNAGFLGDVRWRGWEDAPRFKDA